MYAVAEVDVHGAAAAVEHLGALCAAAVGVAGGVLLAAVGLGLGDDEAALRALGRDRHQRLAEELRRYDQRVPLEKFAPEPHEGLLSVSTV